MHGKNKKSPRQKDLTDRYMDGSLDEDRIDPKQRFSSKNKNLQRDKTQRTSNMRADEQSDPTDVQSLPIGQVTQVHSNHCKVEAGGRSWLCVLRKTLTKVIRGDIVVGDFVRFRNLDVAVESGQPEAMIEQLLPRKTVLTRADSFKQIESHPIVANAEQMLIVTSVREPGVKWGLVDRMLIAAQGGGLLPIVCLNKVDLVEAEDDERPLHHYSSMGVKILRTSVTQKTGIDEAREILRGHETVLAGHSGVGKSSLIRAIVPELDVRIGEISAYTGKGRHTTTTARRYELPFGGSVIDTPGVKLFGLWGVTAENLMDYFPDVAAANAPEWRKESFKRIADSLGQ